MKEAYIGIDSSHYISYVPPVSDDDDDESSGSLIPSGGSSLPIENIPSESDFKAFYKDHSGLVLVSGGLFILFLITLVYCCIRIKKIRSETYVFKTYSEVDRETTMKFGGLNETLADDETLKSMKKWHQINIKIMDDIRIL